MAIINFPPVEQADQYGLLAIGGDLQVDSLLLAYSRGIFPWPVSDEFPLAWFSPDPRGVLKTKDFYLSRSFRKFINKDQYSIQFNQDFETIIKLCAESENRKNQEGTWISDEIIRGYTALHRAGHAYSVEVYNKKTNEIAGGLYGVHIGDFFSGESMFYLEANASKLALASLLIVLMHNGVKWLDTQMVTPVVQSLGGIEIERKTYLTELKEQLKREHRPQIFSNYSSAEIIDELKKY